MYFKLPQGAGTNMSPLRASLDTTGLELQIVLHTSAWVLFERNFPLRTLGICMGCTGIVGDLVQDSTWESLPNSCSEGMLRLPT